MPHCHCRFAQCNGASISVAAFNKHKREDKGEMLQLAFASVQGICHRQDEAIAAYSAPGCEQRSPTSDNPGTKVRSSRVETYQHMVNSRLHQLSVLEKKVNELISSIESSLLNLGVPQHSEEAFPLSSSAASIRLMFHELSQVTSRSPAVQEAKSSISNLLYSVTYKLRDARKLWKEAQKRLPKPVRQLSRLKGFYDAEKHTAPILAATDPIIQATVFTMVVLHVILHVSRRGCRFFLGMVYYIVQLTLLRKGTVLSVQNQKLLSDFPKDPETAMKQFLLDGTEVIYAACPKAACQKLYAPQFHGSSPIPEYPMYCSHHEFGSGSDECGTRLTRPRIFGEATVQVPIKRFVSFSFKEYVASLTSRVGFEDYMDNAAAAAEEEGATMRDVFDGQFLKTFNGPDGNLFAPASGHYLFSLGFDFFNPLTNKQSGKKTSCGIISVVCLNLPIHLRYKPENMFLAGIIPGPNEPPLTATNHYLAPIIDEFLEFWDPGVRFSRTANFPDGRLIYGALVLVVCDLLAARKISAFASHTSEHFCNVCHCRLSKPGLQSTDFPQWKTRTDKQYRKAMDQYEEAATSEDREDMFKRNGVRSSELKRLEYFDMVKCVVVDPAHNHFLGLLNEHFTNILGIRLKSYQETPVIDLNFDVTPSDASEPTVAGVERVRNWLRSPFSTTFGPTRQHGVKKLMRVNADALQFVCDQIRCPLPILPENRKCHVKQEYCESILDWREVQGEIRDPGAETSTSCGHVLQADEMSGIWSDIEQMLTPSWMTSVPARLGQPSHGKLKADQWRVLGTTHLAISLVRIWALNGSDHERSRKCYDVLHVTLSLISAITLATSHTVTKATAEAYLTHMLDYLNGVKRLFPGYRLKPNHHMALHIHHYLTLFGPVHSWWAFPFERLVGNLQRVPSNGKLGELEGTMSRAYTRMGNLQALLSKQECPEVIQHSRPIFEALFYPQLRENVQVSILPEPLQYDCRGRSFDDEGTERVLPPDLRFAFLRVKVDIPIRARLLSHILLDGLRFTTSSKHPGNSCMMIMLPDFPEPIPAQLVQIVCFRSSSKQYQTYLGVRRHKHAKITRDPYLKFPVLRAQMWDAGLQDIEVILPRQVVCHFACLPLKFEGQELVVAMSLSRTIVFYNDEDGSQAEN